MACLEQDAEFYSQLSGDEQAALLRLAVASGVPRVRVFATIRELLLHGKPRGRCVAAQLLAEFNGSEANALAIRGLADEDPNVQAALLVQLRRRGIPGVIQHLLGEIDNPNEAIRDAVRSSLEEFTFERYAGAFDSLDEQVRQGTAMLIKKLDPNVVSRLRRELTSGLQTRLMRALAITRVMELTDEVEQILIALLSSEEYLVRAQVAEMLGQCRSSESLAALESAAYDRNATVREAVARSLTWRKRESF